MGDASDIFTQANREMETLLNYGDRLQHILGVLDPRIQKFLANNRQEQPFPAVDLASGEGYFPLAYSHHFSSRLEWYPTNYQGFSDDPVFREGYFGDTLSSLSWFFAQAASGKEKMMPTLLKDSNGDTLNEGDLVKLTGLSNASYNSIYGIVLGVDPADPNRVSVRCIHRSVPMSFKPSNMTRMVVKSRRKNPHDAKTIQGLIDRARLVDLLDRSTWSNVVAELEGRCALVTCTNLLTCLGHREPRIWMDCLELASKLLAPGGYFLQYDTSSHGKFSHGKTMTGFVKEKSLGLILEGRKEEEYSGHGKMFIMLWRREAL